MASTPRRHGFTLLELLGALTITAIVLVVIAGVSLREQRIFASLAARGAASEQVGAAAALLPIDLTAASPAAGDIRQALDTALELRATIASAVVCDTSGARIVLSPAVSGAETFASLGTAPVAGDTAWVLTPADSAAPWIAYAIGDVRIDAGGGCAADGPSLDASSRATPRVSLALLTPSGGAMPALASMIGVPLRITRPLRYSLYRASDNAWYLGAKDWNVTSQRFNGIQPVAGAFLPPSSAGLRFQYVDRSGAALPTPVADRAAIALVQIELRSEMRGTISVAREAPFGVRRESTIVSVAVRNRP
jgi:prepilin-type N-terminal cleavage/methylation domain-containing protein